MTFIKLSSLRGHPQCPKYHTHIISIPISPIIIQVSIPRKLVKHSLVKLLQLRTPQVGYPPRNRIRDLIDRPGDIANQTLEKIRGKQHCRLVAEAREVVSLKEGLSIVDTAGEIGDVDACETVGCAGVAAYGGEFRVCEDGLVGVDGEEGDGVFIADCSFCVLLARCTIF